MVAITVSGGEEVDRRVVNRHVTINLSRSGASVRRYGGGCDRRRGVVGGAGRWARWCGRWCGGTDREECEVVEGCKAKVKHSFGGGETFSFDVIGEFVKIKEFGDVSVRAKGGISEAGVGRKKV
jgi:hypothetical protein